MILLDSISKFFGSFDSGGGSFHPEKIRNNGEFLLSGNAELDATFDEIETFVGSGLFPIKVEFESHRLSELSSSIKTSFISLDIPFLKLLGLFSSLELALDSFDTSINKCTGFLVILGADSTNDEGLIDGVNVVIDKLGREGISSGNNNEGASHKISLESGSSKSGDMFSAGNKDLATHMAALLGTSSLILHMNTSSTSINHILDELHN